MIRAIVAIDSKKGMANDRGIPWHLPTDIQYFRDKVSQGRVLMGYGTYLEIKQPFNAQDYVATTKHTALRPNFVAVSNAKEFLTNIKDDVWVIGGAGLLACTLDLLEELYITQVQSDFHCSKFFPEFEDKFVLTSESQPIVENGVTFTFQVWHHK